MFTRLGTHDIVTVLCMDTITYAQKLCERSGHIRASSRQEELKPVEDKSTGNTKLKSLRPCVC